MIDYAWDMAAEKAWEWLDEQTYDPEMIRDEDEVRLLYLEEWLGDRGYDVYEMASSQTYARRVVLRNGCAIRVMILIRSWPLKPMRFLLPVVLTRIHGLSKPVSISGWNATARRVKKSLSGEDCWRGS